jgi:uncharacterized hydantoinase/oxoprolinase family protein
MANIISIDLDNLTKEELIELQQQLSKAAIATWERDQKHKAMRKHLELLFDTININDGTIERS